MTSDDEISKDKRVRSQRIHSRPSLSDSRGGGEAPGLRVDPATIKLVRIEDLFRLEVSQAAPAPVAGVVPGKVGHEAPEVFNPGVELVPLEQVERPLKGPL